MTALKEKIKRVNWSSNFLIEVIIVYLSLIFIPHILFRIPVYLQTPGWELMGDPQLPTHLLSIFYILFGIIYFLYTVIMIDYKFNREIREVKSEQVTFEDIQIPVGGGNFLVGDLVKGPLTLKKNAPVLIVCHGLGSIRQRNYHYGISFTFLGFAVIFYDARGHGETAFGRKWDGYYIIRDLNKVIDYIQKRAENIGDISDNNIVALGFSLGGAVVLNEGYLDQRIKFVIGCCTFGDYKETTERKIKNITEVIIKAGYELQGINLTPSYLQSRLVSPILNSFNRKKGFFDHPVYWEVDNNYRVCLAHAKDDNFVNFENFEENRDFLNLRPENYIIFEKGNHKFAGGETALIGKMLLWFWQRGY